MKKCICRKCSDCKLFVKWDMVNNEGLRKQASKCLLFVLADEIPKIKGSMEGVQADANSARNRAEETKAVVRDFTERAVKTINGLASMKFIGDNKK
jgi:hypothetical protein